MAEHVVCDRCGESTPFASSMEYGSVFLGPYHPPQFDGDPLADRRRIRSDELTKMQLCGKCVTSFQEFIGNRIAFAQYSVPG